MTVLSPAVVDRVRDRAARRQLDVRRLLVWLLIALPMLVGWLAGQIVTAALYMWAALCEGYASARPEQQGQQR